MRLYVPLAALLCCVLISCHGTLGRSHRYAEVDLYEKNLENVAKETGLWRQGLEAYEVNALTEKGFGSVLSTIFKAVVPALKATARVSAKVIKVAGHTLMATSLVLSLSNALSGGCATHPNICRYRDEIDKYEKDALQLSGELKLTYEGMQGEYKKVQSIVTNNIYLERYIEDLLDDLEGIKSISEAVDEYLSKQINLHSKMSKTSDEYLRLVVRPNEYMIRNVKSYFDQTKNAALKTFGIGLGLQLGIQLVSVGIEAGITKAVNAFKQTKVVNFQGSNNRFKVFAQRLKLAYKPTRPNLKFSPKSFARNMKTSLTKGYTNMINKLKNPKGLVKSYFSGLNKAQTCLNFITGVTSAVMIFLDNKQWKEMENKLAQSVGHYKQYVKELREQKAILDSTDKNMGKVVNEQVDNFKETAKNFTDGFDDTMSDTNIIESFGQNTQIPKNGVQLAKLGEINRNNVLQKQQQVIEVVKNAAFSLKEYRKFIQGFKITLQIIQDGINKKNELSKIMDVLKISFSNNDNLKSLKDKFTDVNKVLCALANLLPDKQNYGSVPLESIKEPCIQPDAVITTTAYKKQRTEFGLKFIIQTAIEDAKTKGNPDNIHDLASVVNRFLSNDPLVVGGERVSASSKKFMCMIADAMPKLSQYYYFELSKVRGSACSRFSDNTFQDLFFEAEEKAGLMEMINRYRKSGRDPCKSFMLKNSGLIKC